MPAERERHLPLVERARPDRLSQIIGNARARAEIRQWAEAWAASSAPPRFRAMLLAGPPGVGKTTAALAVARDFDWSVVEMNASEARNESAIEQVAGRASLTHTLGDTGIYRRPSEGGRTLILLDEADCLTGRVGEEARARPTPISLREFLRSRYGTIERLTEAWASTPGKPAKAFAKWDDVPVSVGRGAWTRLAAAQRDLADFRGTSRPRDLSDRGGLGAIARLVKETRQPVMLTVNDERPLSRYSTAFRSTVARVRFQPVRDDEIRSLLESLARRFHLDVQPAALQAIAVRAHGDVRAALNDLDAISPLPAGPMQLSLLGGRDAAADFYALTEEALTSHRWYRSVEIRDRLDATPEDLFPWIEENLPRFAASASHRADAFELLARADLQLTRARRFRVYGLWSYASELMTGGVGTRVSDRASPSGRPVAFPQFLSEMGRSRAARAMRSSVLGKSGRLAHLSRGKGVEAFLPFLFQIFDVDRRAPNPAQLLRLRQAIARQAKLTPEEVGYLMRREPESEAVRDILEEPPGEEPEPVPTAATSEGSEPSSVVDTVRNDPPRQVQRRLGEF